MATIDSKKLLPSSTKGAVIDKPKFLVPIKNISTKKISGSDLKPVDKKTETSGSLVVVKKKIIKLDSLIQNNLLIDQKERTRKKREEERSKVEKRESDIEKKVKRNDVKSDLIPSLPGQSIFDKINRFIGFTLLGYLFNKYGELLPKLMEFGKVLKPVGDFFEGFAKNLLKGVVDFIEFGYKAYDQSRDFVKQIGGEGAQKTFDEFSKNLNTLLNGAIGAAMLIASTAPRSPGGAAGGLGASLSKSMSGVVPKPTGGFGAGTAMTPGRYRLPGQSKAGGSFNTQLARKGLTFEKSVAAQQASKKSAEQIAKQGAKQSLKSIAAVPVIGALIGFIIDTVVFREKPSRAAAGAVGSAIGQGIGIALAGGTTFGLGAGVGMFVGGFAGDWIGKALYDTIVGYKQTPIQARAEGGQVTRGGQTTVAPSRKLKTRTRKAPPRIQPQKTQPGKDVGGKLKIEELYGKDEPGKRSALRALRKSSDDVKRMKSINGLAGSMFGAGIDMALGQKPDKNLSKNLGNIFGSVIASAVDMELNNSFGDISKTIAMANGGVVPSREIGKSLSIGERIGSFISRALAVSIESSATRILQNLRNEMNLEGGAPGGGDGGGGGGGDDDGGGGGGGGMFSGKAADIPPEGKALLDAIAGSESRGYNSRYPSKTFDNGWRDHPRISERILSGPNKGKTSDAAGRYQFLSTTWDQYKPAKEFTPENQDIAAYRLAVAAYGYGESGLIKDLKKDPLKVANKLSGTWTSLPGGMEPNNATNGFISRYQARVKKYQSQSGPSLSAKGVKKFSRSDITSFFKQQESFRSKPHEGMDIAANQGTAISFGMGGTVLGVWRTNSGARDANGGYGTYMDIKFSDGRIARIAHLSDVPSSIKRGTTFGANQIIAYSGGKPGAAGSGRSGGPHIHLEQLSQPMGSQETTKGKVDPLRGGLFDLIQKGGTKLSLAPSQSSAVASLNRSGVLEQDTRGMIITTNTVAFVPIIKESSSMTA